MHFPEHFLEFSQRLIPELVLFGGALLCLLTGLSPSASLRRATGTLAVGTALLATLMAAMPGAPQVSPIDLPALPTFVKISIGVLGALLLMAGAKVPDRLRQVIEAESASHFDAGDDYRGEFFAFTLISMAGAMLCADAGDLIWLLLALELVSLPSYVMIACSRDDGKAQESAIKYFFLGAMAAAVFIYGFAMMYGATGTTDIAAIRAYVQGHGMSNLMLTGVALSVVGIGFKIAAAPLHSYVLDVYEGAATPVTAFLAVIPKIAGFAALILVLGTVAWFPAKNGGITPLPPVIWSLVALMAIASMVIGNTLGVVQKNVKRVMGCSSIAQSGYLMLGLLAGPAMAIRMAAGGPDGSLWQRLQEMFANAAALPQTNGLAALCFYLMVYGLGTIGLLAALGCLVDKHGHDATTWESLNGLRHRQPLLAIIIAVCSLSLMGLPVLGGFVGKIMLADATLAAHSPLAVALVLLLVINSAVSAAYYLRLAYAVLLGADNTQLDLLPVPSRRIAALVAALAVVALGGFLAGPLLRATQHAAGVQTTGLADISGTVSATEGP